MPETSYKAAFFSGVGAEPCLPITLDLQVLPCCCPVVCCPSLLHTPRAWKQGQDKLFAGHSM